MYVCMYVYGGFILIFSLVSGVYPLTLLFICQALSLPYLRSYKFVIWQMYRVLNDRLQMTGFKFCLYRWGGHILEAILQVGAPA